MLLINCSMVNCSARILLECSLLKLHWGRHIVCVPGRLMTPLSTHASTLAAAHRTSDVAVLHSVVSEWEPQSAAPLISCCL